MSDSIKGRAGMLDLVLHLHMQREFSEKTFGPGPRTLGVLDHISKELREVAENPSDLEEWIDIVLLALDGAWRCGHDPEEVAFMLADKLNRNMKRDWPDWRKADPDKAIEHVRAPRANKDWEDFQSVAR